MKRRYPEKFEDLTSEEKENLAKVSFKRIVVKRGIRKVGKKTPLPSPTSEISSGDSMPETFA